ncbi:hypothetical protein [Ectothiorhodospira lacustris]|uniref:hypothetical protein n=1 Tax=Ectothiorhodospira lacustris TaxID=2899127 RepID=UPI001EE98661|nr:hypothetical protein [Ectothiorhodospira lacustris]MCG5510366.1 hypothetical protein [Ectothiorhodospira lacustris]MCG5522112.1 hypothetical protein [Ectothiorhodospira lacustris]
MDKLIDILGTLIALLGITACLASAVTWLMGEHYLFRLELIVILTGGIGLLVTAILFKVQVLVMRSF